MASSGGYEGRGDIVKFLLCTFNFQSPPNKKRSKNLYLFTREFLLFRPFLAVDVLINIGLFSGTGRPDLDRSVC